MVYGSVQDSHSASVMGHQNDQNHANPFQFSLHVLLPSPAKPIAEAINNVSFWNDSPECFSNDPPFMELNADRAILTNPHPQTFLCWLPIRLKVLAVSS